jgi:ABC-type glycerol-3-phosphate transport system substrate-binding protein
MINRLARGAIAVAAVTALTLTGCSAAQPDAGGDAQAPAEIDFLAFQSPAVTEEFWEESVAKVLEDFPNLKVNILYTPDLDRQGYAKTLLATGTLPDVIIDVPLREFAEAGALLPYDDSIAENFDAPLETIGGKAYSLPVGVQVIPQVYYNKTVFDELGLEAPTTYAEFEAAAATIKAAGLTPFLIGGGGADSWTTTMLLNGIINSDVLGVDPEWVEKRRAGEVKFTDPEFAAAVEKWVA